jgi:hypothetical protein
LDFSSPFGSIDSLAEYNGDLCVASGGSIYRHNETGWSVAKTYDDVYAFLNMKVYDGKIYLATRDQGWRKPMYLGSSGFSGRVVEFDGENWTTILDYDYWIFSLETYNGRLYAGTANNILTHDGTGWNASFCAHEGAYYATSFTIFNDSIYVGMGNGYIFSDPVSTFLSQSTPVVPEFSTPIFLIILTIGISIWLVIRKRRRMHSPKQIDLRLQ